MQGQQDARARITAARVGEDAIVRPAEQSPASNPGQLNWGVVHGRAEAQELRARERGALSFAPLGLALVPSSTHGLRRGLHSVAALRLKSEYWIAVSAQNSAPTRTSALYVKGEMNEP